jgi:hypothetical protein
MHRVPIREFIDAAGARWKVWNTVPTTGGVAGSMRLGWLTFESDRDRRRLAPIPTDWEEASVAQLRSLCSRAEPIGRTPHTGSWRVERDDR